MLAEVPRIFAGDHLHPRDLPSVEFLGRSLGVMTDIWSHVKKFSRCRHPTETWYEAQRNLPSLQLREIGFEKDSRHWHHLTRLGHRHPRELQIQRSLKSRDGFLAWHRVGENPNPADFALAVSEIVNVFG